MNRKQIPFKRMAIALCLIGMGAYGQKQTKTYSENFMVADATVLDINTSHADIEFETWDKPQVQIEAVIELDGVPDAEVERYFQTEGFQIVGNSKKISVNTAPDTDKGLSFVYGTKLDRPSFELDLANMPQIHFDSMQFDFGKIVNLQQVMEMPPIPPAPPRNFDYAAFKKDGEKYLKKWQKNSIRNM